MSRRTRTTRPPTTPPTTPLAAPARLAFGLPRVPSGGNGLTQEQATYQLLNWLTHLPDPDLVLQKLGMRRVDLRKLETDDEVAQCLEKRREAILATPWRLEPGNSRHGRWLVDELTPHMDALLGGAFNAIPYGYSVMEVVYAPRPDGRIGLDRVAEKPFEWFVPQHYGAVRYYPEDGRGGAEGILCDPLKYFMTVRNASYRNPYGDALLSRLYWPAFFRANGWRFWSLFLERFGTPLLLGQAQGDAEAMARQLTGAVQDAVIVVGHGDSLSAVESGKDGQQFRMFEEAILARIQKTVLGQTLSSDAKATGLGSGVADLHRQVLEEKRRADIRLVSATVQRLVDALSALNGQRSAPQFVMADDSGLEMARAERDALLVEKGILELSEEYLLDRYDFKPGDFVVPGRRAVADPETDPETDPEADPEDAREEDREDTREADPEPARTAVAGLLTLSPGADKKPRFTAGQQAIEDQIDPLLSRLLSPRLLSPVSHAAIQGAIRAATSPEDLADRLAVVLADADPTQLGAIMDKAFFAADIMGYAHAGGGGEVQRTDASLAAPPRITDLDPNSPLSLAALRILEREAAATPNLRAE